MLFRKLNLTLRATGNKYIVYSKFRAFKGYSRWYRHLTVVFKEIKFYCGNFADDSLRE